MFDSEKNELTPQDEVTLHSLGLSLLELLAYKRPSDEQFTTLHELLGMSIVDAILMADLRKNIIDALAQLAPLLQRITEHTVTTEELRAAQAHFIVIVTDRMSGNPYPGVNFSLAKAQQVLEMATSRDWDLDNFADSFKELMAFCNQD